MIRILEIAPYKYLPARTGGEIGIADFATYLGRYSELTVASVTANKPEGPLPYQLWKLFRDSRFRYLNPFYIGPLKQAIRNQQIDLLLIEHPYMGWMAVWLQALTGCSFVIHSRNIEGLRFKTMGKKWWLLLQAYEKWVHRKAAFSFFISQDDAEEATSRYNLDPKKVGVATHGITPPVTIPDKQMLRQQLIRDHQLPADVVIYTFNGALGYLPNQQAVRMITDKIYPLLEQRTNRPYVILISGKGLSADVVEKINQTNGKIIYTGFVPSIGDYLAGSDMFINPVVEGGGVKTKVLEALAWQKTVVSTASGALGIHTAVCGSKLKIAGDDQWEDFIALMLDLRDIDMEVPSAYFEYYSNDNIARSAIAVMQSLVH
ncbi:glycosyltransferase [Chitinophaga pendula]|uniref:glycosyltransferase n=1 Tax=Chitinophaga TaxID=79328 RepID=UPI000BAFB3AE|nr:MULTISPECIES: glycosyltransferase [Chitinophaga]ASZ12549.1 hypothetical protein CK934_17080 [Chitinophaga sp. MD30]UCJ09847.1 glycosyltransferase [Chitinophaga pendula]